MCTKKYLHLISIFKMYKYIFTNCMKHYAIWKCIYSRTQFLICFEVLCTAGNTHLVQNNKNDIQDWPKYWQILKSEFYSCKISGINYGGQHIVFKFELTDFQVISWHFLSDITHLSEFLVLGNHTIDATTLKSSVVQTIQLNGPKVNCCAKLIAS